MSIVNCPYCNKYYDQDYNAEHECECEYNPNCDCDVCKEQANNKSNNIKTN